jgi:hypothetical protein
MLSNFARHSAGNITPHRDREQNITMGHQTPMDVRWRDGHDQGKLGLLFQAKGGTHSKNTKGRVEMEDGLQNTLGHFDELTSKGAPMK